jgi:pimeloyl-ACP methyl ester carboxylesterase
VKHPKAFGLKQKGLCLVEVDERNIFATYSLAPKKSRNWIVFLPESGSDFRRGDRREIASLVGPRVAKSFNFLVVNKTGVGPDGTDRTMYELAFRRVTRIDDALAAINAVVPRGDKIHLVGYSEGAYLAPQIGSIDARIKSVSMIGGGTRGWLKEELSNASKKERRQYEKQIATINSRPRSLEKWNGFSYATWHSYRGDHTLRALKDVRVPTLAILGARDRVIDLRSTIVDLMLVSENQPIQVHIFGDCGHHFSKHWLQVSRVLGRFLRDQR